MGSPEDDDLSCDGMAILEDLQGGALSNILSGQFSQECAKFIDSPMPDGRNVVDPV